MIRKGKVCTEKNPLQSFFSAHPVSILFFALLFFSWSLSFSQSKKELEKKRSSLEKEIEQTGKQIEETKKIKTGSLNQLSTLNRQIQRREELIEVINSEIGSLDNRIDESNSNISGLQQKMDLLRKEYANTIRYAYRNRGMYDIMMFLFSSADFNQAYKRMLFLKQYAEFRKKQRDEIIRTQTTLANKVNELEDKKNSKEKLLTAKEREKQTLTADKQMQEKIVSNMSKREKKLRSDLKEKQKAAEKLSHAIEALIKKEMDEARKKAAIASRKKGIKPETKKVTDESVFASTPELQKLSAGFANNKGKLPWPVEKGIITGYYGRHQHPLWKDVYTNNNGIDISTVKDASARSIFDGKVSSIVSIPGAGRAVIIRHGEFLTVYSNLDEVFVKSGDIITTRQRIGSVITDGEEEKTELHLEIWRGSTRLDPADWIAAK
jgi:septal ring factor EnvC (AmiA/AmiB activator)